MELEIQKIAELARLELTPEEKLKLQKDLDSILDYIKQLQELDTSKVLPTSHVLDSENVFRDDEVRFAGTRDESLAQAPDREGPFFKVPKVVEK